jgi:hypothetical protein
MWNDEEFRTKARRYFLQAEELTANDEHTLLWCALGLEFLLRAPLADVNPVLLADPQNGDGYSMLHAAGYPGEREPISVKTKTVIERLQALVESFDSSIKQDVEFIVALRNRELHTSISAFANVRDDIWLPKFLRVLRVLATHFHEDVDEYLSEEFLAHAEKLTDAEDKRLKHEISKRIAECSKFYENLNDSEKSGRRPGPFDFGPTSRWQRRVQCPACKEQKAGRLVGEPVRYGKENLDGDGDIVRRVFIISNDYTCPMCNLKLVGIPEIAAAGLEQQWDELMIESLEDRYGDMTFEPDYGND